MSYRNNLKKGDRVQHAETKRLGNGTKQPREDGRFAAVQWQGNTGHVYDDVLADADKKARSFMRRHRARFERAKIKSISNEGTLDA